MFDEERLPENEIFGLCAHGHQFTPPPQKKKKIQKKIIQGL